MISVDLLSGGQAFPMISAPVSCAAYGLGDGTYIRHVQETNFGDKDVDDV